MYCVSVLINKILKTETCQLALWSLVSTWCKIKMLHQRNSIVLHKQCKLGISIQFDIQMGPLPPILLGKRRELQECTNISSEDGGGHPPTHPPDFNFFWHEQCSSSISFNRRCNIKLLYLCEVSVSSLIDMPMCSRRMPQWTLNNLFPKKMNYWEVSKRSHSEQPFSKKTNNWEDCLAGARYGQN